MAAKKTIETPVKSDKVTVNLPRPIRPDEQNFRLVGLNGKFFKVMKGVTVEVPRAVAEILTNAEEADNAALDYIAENAH